MRRLALGLSLAAAAVALAPAAHAGPVPAYVATGTALRTGAGVVDYAGGCTFDAVSQSQLTGDGRWTAGVAVAVVATRASLPYPQASVTGVRCTWFVNGIYQGALVTAPDLVGATANATTLGYAASATDTITICTDATIAGNVITPHCAEVQVSAVPPIWPGR
jgi:hypothetical protein